MKMSIYDAHRLLIGSVKLRLDWGTKQWLLEQDDHLAWLRTCNTRRGPFEVRDNGVIWIWDQAGIAKRNPVIVWDAPLRSSDMQHHAGKGCLLDPRDSGLKNGQISWTTDKITTKSKLSPIRQAILDVLRRNLPAYPAVPRDPPNCVADTAGSAFKGVTNCGALPGFVVKSIPGAAELVPDKMFVSWEMTDATTGERVTKTGHAHVSGPMTAWEQFAQYVEKRLKLPGYIWVPFKAGENKRPQPGDIYVLAKTPGPAAYFAHVGFIVSSTGTDWRTADAGQGNGFGVGYQKRVFDPKTGTITLTLANGSTLPPDLGTRYLKGWVDVGHLFKGWKSH